MKKSNAFKYGDCELEVRNHATGVPIEADEIELDISDKRALALAIKENIACLLIGETGTGKTSIVKYLAYRLNQGYTRISMTGYATPDELIGSKSVKNGTTYYEDGVLTKAMREGHIVVLDEINATPPDCLFILHGLLDDERKITLPNGDIVEPHQDFRFFATGNPDYEGTKSLNRAFVDRFGIILAIDVLTPKKEQALLTKRLGIEPVMAEKMVTIGTMARVSYKDQKTITYVSTRGLLQWGKLISQGIEPKASYTQAIVNKARLEDRSAFADFYNAVFKEPADVKDRIIIITQSELDQKEADKLTYVEAYNRESANVSALRMELSSYEALKTDKQEIEKIKAEAEEKIRLYNEMKTKYDQIKGLL